MNFGITYLKNTVTFLKFCSWRNEYRHWLQKLLTTLNSILVHKYKMRRSSNLPSCSSAAAFFLLSLSSLSRLPLIFLLDDMKITEVQSMDDLANIAGMVPTSGATPLASMNAEYIETSAYGVHETINTTRMTYLKKKKLFSLNETNLPGK